MVAWGAAAVAAQAKRQQFAEAEDAYDKAGKVRSGYGGHSEDVEVALSAAVRAAGTAEMRAYAAYYVAFEAAVSARAAACDAYIQAGLPQAVQALGTVARNELDWSPDLEDAVTALLTPPVSTP